MVLFVHIVTERSADAVRFCFERIFRHTAFDFFGKLCRIELCIAFKERFQQDSFRALRNGFLCGDDSNAVLFEYVFVICAVVAVTGKAIQFPNKHGVEQVFITVLNHMLEFGTVIGLCGLRSIYVIADHLNIVKFGILHTLAELTFNTRFILFFRTESCVNYSFHGFSPIIAPLESNSIFLFLISVKI